MNRPVEFLYYLSVAVGLAIANASFAILAQLFVIADTGVVLLAIAGGAVLLWLVAQTVGELASALPTAPGVRGYLQRAFGEGPATYATYVYLCFIVLVAALESYLFALVLSEWLPNVPPEVVAAGVVCFIATLNLSGVSPPRWFQMGTAAVLALALLGLGLWAVAVSFGVGGAQPAASAARAAVPAAGGGVSALVVVQAVALAMFLMVGFEWVTPIGLRPESYHSMIPRAMTVSVAVNAVLNLAFAAGLGLVMGRAGASQSLVPQLALSRELFGGAGVQLAIGLAALSIASTFNAGLMGGSRLVYLLAREKKLPRWCAKVSLSSGAPVGAILALSGVTLLGTLLMIRLRMEVVAAICGSAIACLIYACLAAAAWKLRRDPLFQGRAYRAPTPPALRWLLAPLLLAIGLLVLVDDPLYGAQPVAALALVALLAAVLWLGFRKGPTTTGKPRGHLTPSPSQSASGRP